jgi:hypothetical protein
MPARARRASPSWPRKRAGPWSLPTGPRCRRPPKPSTSRRPSPATAVATTTAWATTWRLTRTLQLVAFMNTYGKRWPASERSRKAATRRRGRRRSGRPHFGAAAVGAKGAGQVVDLAGAQRRAGSPSSPLRTASGRRGGAAPAGWGRTTRRVAWDAQTPDLQRSCLTGGVGAVALRQPLRAALVGSGADHRGELGLDEGLVDGLGGLADPIVNVRSLECVQSFQGLPTVQTGRGPPCACVFSREPLAWNSLTIARWSLQRERLRRCIYRHVEQGTHTHSPCTQETTDSNGDRARPVRTLPPTARPSWYRRHKPDHSGATPAEPIVLAELGHLTGGCRRSNLIRRCSVHAAYGARGGVSR